MESVEKLIQHIFFASNEFGMALICSPLFLLTISYFTIIDFIRNACMKAEFYVLFVIHKILGRQYIVPTVSLITL